MGVKDLLEKGKDLKAGGEPIMVKSGQNGNIKEDIAEQRPIGKVGEKKTVKARALCVGEEETKRSLVSGRGMTAWCAWRAQGVWIQSGTKKADRKAVRVRRDGPRTTMAKAVPKERVAKEPVQEHRMRTLGLRFSFASPIDRRKGEMTRRMRELLRSIQPLKLG